MFTRGSKVSTSGNYQVNVDIVHILPFLLELNREVGWKIWSGEGEKENTRERIIVQISSIAFTLQTLL